MAYRLPPDGRSCRGLPGDREPCDCREDVRYDRVALRWLCVWCRSRVDLSPGVTHVPPLQPRSQA